MAVGTLGVLDLSVITDTLINMLRDSITNSPLWTSTSPPTPRFTITVSGAQPEAVRNDGDCQLSLYLFHITQDKFQRNSPVTGSRALPIPQHPMSLELYYMLTTYAGKTYTQEQQAISIALRSFYNQPIVKKVIQGDPHQEFSLTMEVQSADELGRLWQAITIPYRLSVVFKVSVIFITPDEPTSRLAPPPKEVGLSVNPTTFPLVRTGQVFGTLRSVTFAGPNNTAANPDIHKFDLSPATAGAGETFLLQGAGLNQDSSRRVYLLFPDATEYEVTSWVVPVPLPPGIPQSDAQLILQLPAQVGMPPDPANPRTPPSGIYQLCVGSDQTKGDKQTIRSNATPFSIAASIKGPALTATPLLTASGSVFTINGAGFTTGKTAVFLDTIALSSSNTGPNPGTFRVNASETAIAFKLPNNLASGRYTVRVRVNQVESAPAWWIDVP